MRYPASQEKVHRDPTFVELEQDTLPWDGADGVDPQRTTKLIKGQWLIDECMKLMKPLNTTVCQSKYV